MKQPEVNVSGETVKKRTKREDPRKKKRTIAHLFDENQLDRIIKSKGRNRMKIKIRQ